LVQTGGNICHGSDLTHTIAHCSMLFPIVGWPTTSALAANLAYLYTLPLCTFFSPSYHNVVIQSTSLQHCDRLYFFNYIIPKTALFWPNSKILKYTITSCFLILIYTSPVFKLIIPSLYGTSSPEIVTKV
jgi:hypothetical protein